MLSETNLREISEILIGDIPGFYPYKKGEDIVEFFNKEFGYHDKYGAGAPSRWMMVRDKLVDMIEKERINSFFDLVFSVNYIKSETEMSLVESADRARECYQKIKDIVNRDMYDIVKNGENFYFISENDDQELIGEGGFANVYFQHSTGLVVKKLKPQFLTDISIRSRFKREYEITNSLTGINGIIKVYDFNEKNYYYTLEKADYTLETYINKFPLEEKHKIIIISKILSIMKEVHSKNIIHRDLSPNNIFVRHRDIVIADFGLGKNLSTIHSHQTSYTNALGQYDYCAPEQIRRLKKADKRSDVFSLGRVINFVMTKEPTNYHHVFRKVSEISTFEEMGNRFDDAGEMLEFFMCRADSERNQERLKKTIDKINSGVYDKDVEIYIFELNGEQLCKKILENNKCFINAVFRYMKADDENALYIVKSVNNCYQSQCTLFNSYDVFATFSYDILSDKSLTYAYEEAADILSFIAFKVNRFYAQGLIKDLDENNYEQYIIDILHEYE